MSEEARKAFGAQVREARRQLGIQQHELAVAIGQKSQSYISQIERGEINLTIDTMAQLCDALGMTLEVIVRSPTGK
jgi:transcriptional regulator with XRE-family HTH domain